MKTYKIIFVATFLFASASISAEGYWRDFNIQEATKQDINDCKLAGEVTGHASYGKTTKTLWKEKAMHEALQQAAELNATHIVWDDKSTGYGEGRFVSGEAYICN